MLEGPVLVAEALRAGAPLEAVYVESAVDPALVDAARAAQVPVLEVADGVLTGITDAVTPRPVLALAELRQAGSLTVLDAAADTGRPALLLVEVGDPGNLGTILRAADAAGCAGVICSRGTVDPWSPKTVRSSAGSVLHVPVAVDADPAEVLAAARERQVPSLGTVVDTGTPLDEVDAGGACLVVLGSEAHGLAPELVADLDVSVTIPMEGRAESLNVAMAASVLVFEASRQRRVRASVDRAGPGGRLDDPSGRGADRTDWTPPPSDDTVSLP